MQADFMEMFIYISELHNYESNKLGFMEIKKLSDFLVGILHTSSRKYFFTLFVLDLTAPTDSTSTFCLCADIRRAAP